MSIIEIVSALIAVLAGIGAGVALQRRRSARVLASGEESARAVVDGARKAADLAQRESSARGREHALGIAREAEAEAQAYADECALIAERLKKRQARREAREVAQRERRAAQEQRAEVVRGREVEARKTRDAAKQLRQGERATLEERARTTAQAICELQTAALVAETRSRSADLLRNLEASGALELDRQAKRVMGVAMQRYTGHCPRERSGSIVALEPAEMERLRRDGNALLGSLREALGVEMLLNEEEGTLRVDTGDGVLRELGRRAIARLVRAGDPGDARGVVDELRRQLEQEIVRHGRAAFEELSLAPAAAEVNDLVGQLNWRTSYTQNQYRHSIEAAQLASMMAAELRLEPRVAKRGTLLHDIGKALTHAVEGSHALLGAEIARRNGEPEVVANAIGAHHGEEAMGSPYAWLATAADAMSGGRPGARREITDAYSDRIGDLEKIAARYEGVQAVHAVQAGRELRIHVDEGLIGDDMLPEMSEKIAQQISDELIFPGQIRVTVIREFRAVAEAG